MVTTIRRWAYRANSFVVLLLGLAAALYASTLKVGTLASPGAGLWPLAVSVALVAFAAILLVTERDTDDYEPLEKRTVIVVLAVLLLAGFVIGFSAIGLSIPAFLLLFIWLRWLAGESWMLTLIVSLVGAAAFVVVFVVLLGVQVPSDPVLSLLTGGRY